MMGTFIVIEGPDGAGKTTLVSRLVQRLSNEGFDCVAVREPGGTPAAEFARRGAFDRELAASPMSELFFFLAARSDLVAKVIRPALAAGKTVLSDRYELSTFAYQVAGRGLPEDAVRSANDLATGNLKANLTLVLDLSFDLAQARRNVRGEAPDRMEAETDPFHRRVAEAFLAASGPGVFHLDATASPQDLEERALFHIRNMVSGTMARPAGST